MSYKEKIELTEKLIKELKESKNNNTFNGDLYFYGKEVENIINRINSLPPAGVSRRDEELIEKIEQTFRKSLNKTFKENDWSVILSEIARTNNGIIESYGLSKDRVQFALYFIKKQLEKELKSLIEAFYSSKVEQKTFTKKIDDKIIAFKKARNGVKENEKVTRAYDTFILHLQELKSNCSEKEIDQVGENTREDKMHTLEGNGVKTQLSSSSEKQLDKSFDPTFPKSGKGE